MGDVTVFPQKTYPMPVKTGPQGPITPENFWDRGLAMIRENYPDSAPVARFATPEYEAWARYFDIHLRWRPYVMSMVEAGQSQGLTLPAQWPEWFDPSYRAA
jgi:hypothetical protein